MVTKQLIKTYHERKCPRLIWLMNNEKTAFNLYQKILEQGLNTDKIIEDLSSFDDEDAYINNFNDLLELLKDNKELIPFVRELINDNNLDIASKIILNMKNLQEISLASMKYFYLKYEDQVKRADTIDGTLMGIPLYKQDKIKENTQKYLSDPSVKVILEGQIDEDEFRARWDALVKNEDGTYTIYEVKGTSNIFKNKNETKIKDRYRLDIMFQYYVYEKYFKDKLDNIVLVQLNKEFEFDGDAEYPLNDERLLDLFKEVDSLVDEDEEFLSLKNYIIKNIEELTSIIENIKIIISKEKEPLNNMQYECRKGGKCLLFPKCHSENKYPDQDSIFQLTNFGSIGGNWRNTVHLINELQIHSITEIPYEYIEEKYPLEKDGKRKAARMQIEAALHPDTKEYIFKQDIKNLINEEYTTFPLMFFDFETFQYPLPLVNNEHPWEQICSQYSMHVVEEDYDLNKHDFAKGIGGGITHYEFLGNPKYDLNKNPEQELIETMLEQFKLSNVDWKSKKFTLVAYNKSFECTQFARMAKKYPQYNEFLSVCKERTVDLMDFFTKGFWYKKAYNGRVSLKVISPNMQADENIMKNYQNLMFDIKDTLDYHTATDVIYNGGIALDVYQSLLRASLQGKEFAEYDTIRNGLLKYCKKDSWGTVIIYDILKRKAYEVEK